MSLLDRRLGGTFQDPDGLVDVLDWNKSKLELSRSDSHPLTLLLWQILLLQTLFQLLDAPTQFHLELLLVLIRSCCRSYHWNWRGDFRDGLQLPSLGVRELVELRRRHGFVLFRTPTQSNISIWREMNKFKCFSPFLPFKNGELFYLKRLVPSFFYKHVNTNFLHLF